MQEPRRSELRQPPRWGPPATARARLERHAGRGAAGKGERPKRQQHGYHPEPPFSPLGSASPNAPALAPHGLGQSRFDRGRAAQQFFTNWEKTAKDLVAALRSEAGRNPHDRALTDLIGELSTRSEPFRKSWAAHNVRYHQTGRKRLHHPTVGDLELDYEVMELTADSGLRLAAFTAEPGTRSAEALDLLASWTATRT